MDKGSKIRVMFVTPCFGYGGLERVMLDIISGLDRSRFTPLFCTLLTPDTEMFRKLENLDIPCTVIDKGEGVSWSLVFRLARLLRRERIDLVNSHDIGATLYAAPQRGSPGLTRSSIRITARYLQRNGCSLFSAGFCSTSLQTRSQFPSISKNTSPVRCVSTPRR